MCQFYDGIYFTVRNAGNWSSCTYMQSVQCSERDGARWVVKMCWLSEYRQVR